MVQVHVCLARKHEQGEVIGKTHQLYLPGFALASTFPTPFELPEGGPCDGLALNCADHDPKSTCRPNAYRFGDCRRSTHIPELARVQFP